MDLSTRRLAVVACGLLLGFTAGTCARGQTLEAQPPVEDGHVIRLHNVEQGSLSLVVRGLVDGLEVVVDYQSSPNYVPGTSSDDQFTVFPPDGFIAIPGDGTIPEDAFVDILIVPFMGM